MLAYAFKLDSMRLLWLFAILILGTGFYFHENEDPKDKYPQDYFRSPINSTIRLSGTFGELRPNHFHAGIDIKGKIGLPLVSIADGYVQRIKIQSGGYGKVLYIQHPNGYTSVYAHLHRFAPELEAYVKSEQYRQQKFELELFPEANRFPFKKGQSIGKMGTTGRSYGPHLHFEIRDSQTEQPINPLLFGIQIKDKIEPKLHQIKIYQLNDKHETTGTRTKDIKKGKYGYYVGGDTLYIPAWRAGFALKTYDHMNGASNWNGVYSIKMYVDEVLKHHFRMEKFGFRETRYINAHMDYEEQIEHKSYFNRCFRLRGNQLGSYPVLVDDGVVQLYQDRAQKIRMVAEDLHGNKSEVSFHVKRAKEVKTPPSKTFNFLLPYSEASVIDQPDAFIHFPKGTLYEDLYLNYHSSYENSKNVYSPVLHLMDYTIPVHQFYTLGLKSKNLPDSLKSKAFIAYCQKDNTIQSQGGIWKEDYLTAEVRDLGDFSIMVDTEAPIIKPLNFKSNMRGYNVASFKVKDNYETARNVAYLNINGYIDGKWVLFEYDAKNDKITHRFEADLPKGKHQLRLIVRDNRGNEAVFEQGFER